MQIYRCGRTFAYMMQCNVCPAHVDRGFIQQKDVCLWEKLTTRAVGLTLDILSICDSILTLRSIRVEKFLPTRLA